MIFRQHAALCSVFISDCSITKFLNRILGLEVHKQNYLFQYFTDNFDYLIEKDKKEGKYDMGILGMEFQHGSHKTSHKIEIGWGINEQRQPSSKSILSLIVDAHWQ